MGYIANHDTRKALELFNRLYADGKDLGALLDEMACLTRDLLILKTAPDAGISMLSGVATDSEAVQLRDAFSSGELTRMMMSIEQTLNNFTRSASRRLDVELCIISLCQPELQIDAASVNARLTRLEEQIKSGNFTAAPAKPQVVLVNEPEEELPPVPDDADAPPEEPQMPEVTQDNAPVGFWSDLVSAVRQELKGPVSGFFNATPNAPVQGVLQGGKVVLQCSNSFIQEMINKPDILSLVSRKASAILGRQISAMVVDKSAAPQQNARLQELMSFGREHSDIVKIKE
jgi:DNA polymerase III gamma/tau subunit